jgi:hypothetical protein
MYSAFDRLAYRAFAGQYSTLAALRWAQVRPPLVRFLSHALRSRKWLR